MHMDAWQTWFEHFVQLNRVVYLDGAHFNSSDRAIRVVTFLSVTLIFNLFTCCCRNPHTHTQARVLSLPFILYVMASHFNLIRWMYAKFTAATATWMVLMTMMTTAAAPIATFMIDLVDCVCGPVLVRLIFRACLCLYSTYICRNAAFIRFIIAFTHPTIRNVHVPFVIVA